MGNFHSMVYIPQIITFATLSVLKVRLKITEPQDSKAWSAGIAWTHCSAHSCHGILFKSIMNLKDLIPCADGHVGGLRLLLPWGLQEKVCHSILTKCGTPSCFCGPTVNLRPGPTCRLVFVCKRQRAPGGINPFLSPQSLWIEFPQ